MTLNQGHNEIIETVLHFQDNLDFKGKVVELKVH